MAVLSNHPEDVSHLPEALFACCVALAGFGFGALLVLRWLDRRISEAVRLPPAGAR